MSQDSEVRSLGRDIMNQLEPGLADKLIGSLKDLDESLPALITDYVFGSVIGRPGLDLKTREMLTVASLVSMGSSSHVLAMHMKGALNVGVTRSELLEVVVQMAIYAGLPAFLNGIEVYRSVLAESGDSSPDASAKQQQ